MAKKAKKYCYKVNKKFYKDFEKLGFVKYNPDKDNDNDENINILFMIPIVLSRDSDTVKGLIDTCNSKSWQEAAEIEKLEQRDKIFAESGLAFEEKDGKFVLIESDDIISEFSTAKLCVSPLDEPIDYLFVVGADEIYRFSSEYIEKCCPSIIQSLVENGYVKRVVAKKM